MSDEVKAAREAAYWAVANARNQPFNVGDDELANAAIDAYEAALSRSHVRVPREPTEAMVGVGAEFFDNYTRDVSAKLAGDIYRAMLATTMTGPPLPHERPPESPQRDQ